MAATITALPTLSPRQEAALLFICRYEETEKRTPTIREICGELGLRSNNPDTYLVPLIAKGYLSKRATPIGKKRDMRNLLITERGASWYQERPFLGRKQEDLLLQ